MFLPAHHYIRTLKCRFFIGEDFVAIRSRCLRHRSTSTSRFSMKRKHQTFPRLLLCNISNSPLRSFSTVVSEPDGWPIVQNSSLRYFVSATRPIFTRPMFSNLLAVRKLRTVNHRFSCLWEPTQFGRTVGDTTSNESHNYPASHTS
jgi:hypothetical protein